MSRMTRTQRKLLRINGALGLGLTLAVMLLDHLDQLKALERWFHDRRANDCQYFRPPPSDKIAHVDIDQNAIDTIGRWPWPRAKQAQVIEEIDRAGPALIALDIKQSDPQDPTYVPLADGTFRKVDNDAILAATIRRSGHVLVPLAMEFDDGPGESDFDRTLAEVLGDDLEQAPEQAAARLRGRGHPDAAADESFNTRFVAARRKVMFRRVVNALQEGDPSVAELRTRLLPKTAPSVTTSPALRLLEFLYSKAKNELPLQRFALPAGAATPPLLTAVDQEAPLTAFSTAAAASGFVDYVKEGDGKVRAIPLLMRHRDQVYPQMGLVIACEMLGVKPSTIRVEAARIVIPKPGGGEVVVPVSMHEQAGTGRPIGTMFDIPYFGTSDWKTIYDYPRHLTHRNHVPAGSVWAVWETRQWIAKNNATADRLLPERLERYFESARASEYARAVAKVDPEDAAPRVAAMTEVVDLLAANLKAYREPPPPLKPGEIPPPPRTPAEVAKENEEIEELTHHHDGMKALLAEVQRLTAQLAAQRADLREKLGGKAVLVGWTAGGLYDFVPTALHDKCPGVVIHGVIADSILTGKMLRRPPRWVTRVMTLLFGLATTAFVCFLGPWRAAVASVALLLGYFVVNGILLYDYCGLIVGVAGPITVMLLTWLSCQLVEVLVEKLERNRITRRFSTYVDPALVDFVIENPESGVTGGQEREMTVVFTDLAGFTTISEALKEGVIPLLNEYLGLMSQIIKRHNGFVNKFLGDGIMFFYNAPRPNPDHAGDAIATVLEMQEKLVGFNEGLVARGLPAITMRAGLVTGTMVVGDAGGDERSDYTVIGDNVNLSARLESANKATGTKVLMHARTAELLGDRYLTRPVARLTVKGKSEGVDTCELLARTAEASDDQRLFAHMGKAIFDAYVASQFQACLTAIEAFEGRFSPTKLTVAYKELCEQYLREPPGKEFNGEIVLHEK